MPSHVERAARPHWPQTLGCYMAELGALGKGDSGGANDEATISREAARSWRRQCKKDLSVYGCDCLECQ